MALIAWPCVPSKLQRHLGEGHNYCRDAGIIILESVSSAFRYETGPFAIHENGKFFKTPYCTVLYAVLHPVYPLFARCLCWASPGASVSVSPTAWLFHPQKSKGEMRTRMYGPLHRPWALVRGKPFLALQGKKQYFTVDLFANFDHQ